MIISRAKHMFIFTQKYENLLSNLKRANAFEIRQLFTIFLDDFLHFAQFHILISQADSHARLKIQRYTIC